jgi:predicted metal-binding membrane protein
MTRGRAPVVAALLAISGVSWAYVIWLARAMDMTGVPAGADMSDMIMPGFRNWTVADAGFMFAMWAIMMVAMMLPSAAPMILLYERVGRAAAAQGRGFAAPGWFAGGYLLVWISFGLGATGLQWLGEQAALLAPGMTAANRFVGAALLLATGLYQWTPLKNACLTQCQAPMSFLQRNGGFRADPRGAFALGFRHGAYCLGCCWALMALLFVGGVMNLLWIAAVTLFVLIEKLVPTGRFLPRLAGLAMIAGAAVLALPTDQ